MIEENTRIMYDRRFSRRKTRRLFQNAYEGKMQSVRRHVSRHRLCDRSMAWEWYARAAVYAAVNGKAEVLTYLLTVLKTFGTSHSLIEVYQECLDQACFWGHHEIVRDILKRCEGRSTNTIDTESLKYAFVNSCLGGNMETARELLLSLKDVLCQDEAVELHHNGMCAALLCRHRELSSFLTSVLRPTPTVIISAARGGDTCICNDMLSLYDASEDTVQTALDRALIAAAAEGNNDVCSLLCSKGAVVGPAAIASAQAHGHDDTWKLLESVLG